MKIINLVVIARKDLLEVKQNKSAWMPMIILPLLFLVFMPLAFMFFPTKMDISMQSLSSDVDMKTFLERMPMSFKQSLEGLNDMQAMITIILGHLWAPMFLMFPLLYSTVIAAESFAGERERKTMEALLYTAASDTELFLGKVMAALVPAIVISWLGFILYIFVLNIGGYPIFGRIWFPLTNWWPLIFWITPALALLGTSATVLISARTQTFMGAYQMSGSLVILVLALMIGQISGVLYLSVVVGLLVGLVCWTAATILTVLAVRSFKRPMLIL
jgi:ABC-2 type transport system permease protein